MTNSRMTNNEGEQRFAVALNEQGRFAATTVGDFTLVPEAGRHVWKGKIAASAAELADQVNGAIKSIIDFGDPFKIEVIAVGGQLQSADCRLQIEEKKQTEIILEANRQLQNVIEMGTPKPLKLKTA
jgi:putative intracellular protease/amidase